MAYDYHGQWDKITGHVAPMYSHPDDFDMTYNAVIDFFNILYTDHTISACYTILVGIGRNKIRNKEGFITRTVMFFRTSPYTIG